MSNFTDFFPAAGGGGGGIPKYQEFTSSGTFTPTQALIDAGGRVSFIIVGGGERGAGYPAGGGSGGGVIWGYATVTSTTGCAVTIGAGGASNGADGGNSSVAFSSAGGTDATAIGGQGGKEGPMFGSGRGGSQLMTAGNSGVLGYGIGGSNDYSLGGTKGYDLAAFGINSGCGSREGQIPGNGFTRITWFE